MMLHGTVQVSGSAGPSGPERGAERIAARQPAASAARATFLIIDDHPVVSFALGHIISSQPGWEVVAHIPTLHEARMACSNLRPTAVLLDLILPGECGLEFLSWLRSESHCTLPIIYSIQPDTVYAQTCIRAGAVGYVGKNAKVETLLATIGLALQGEIAVNGHVVDRSTAKFVRSAAAGGLETLSRRELEVLNLIGQGMSNKKIAQIMCRSAKTVESHRYRISRKLKVENGPALMHFALQHHIASDLMSSGGVPHADRGEQKGGEA